VHDETLEFYSEFYEKTQYTGMLGKFHAFYHKKLEGKKSNNVNKAILEIGAGKGEHLNYIPSKFKSYTLLDLNIDINDSVLQSNINKFPDSEKEKITIIAADASLLPFSDNLFDKIIITCVLHHVNDVPKVLKEARRVLKKNGEIFIYLPCDPGFVYRIIRHLTSHIKQARIMKKKMSYIKYIWSLEHKNHVLAIIMNLRYIFIDDKIKFQRFPFKYLGWNANLFYIITVTKSND
jgi:ubiquinone/menaquinone biosynthesis C-methylase UbiE